MFEQNNAVPVTYRYDVGWLSSPDLDSKLQRWLTSLKSISTLGQLANRMQGGHVHRRKLVQEFYRLMFCYAFFIDERTEKFRSNRGKVPASIMAKLEFESGRINRSIVALEALYQTIFREDLLSSQREAVTEKVQLAAMADRLAIPNAQLALIEKKIQLVKFWEYDLEYGDETIEVGLDKHGKTNEDELFLAFLGNSTTEKVRLVLDVLLKDAHLALEQPSRFKLETTVGAVAHKPEVEWSYEEFKTTVKAEAEAFAGVRVHGSYEIEFTNLKARFEASALVGARVAGQAEASYGRDGVEIKGEVEAMVGAKITFGAELEIGDIFLAEASAEAFAGALAKANVEFSATVNGVKLSIGAEAFAGARVTGRAAVGFKAFGATTLTGEVEGSLTAGVGAKFKFDFESSGAGGQKVDFEAGLTLGVGAEGKAKIEVNTWNLKLSFGKLYYAAYTYAVYSGKEGDFQRQYMSGLRGNKQLFEWTLERLEAYKKAAEERCKLAGKEDAELAQIKARADAIWKPPAGFGPSSQLRRRLVRH